MGIDGDDLDDVPITEVVVVAKLHVGCDLDDSAGMVTTALLVCVCAEDKRRPAEYGAGDDVYRDGAAILLPLESNDIDGQSVGLIELKVEGSRKEAHSGFAKVVIVQLLDPV